MSRLLITGVNGFIGRRLAKHLTACGHSLTGISLEAEGRALPDSVIYRKVDVTNRDEVASVLSSNAFDAVIHLAALVHVRDASLGFDDYARVNYYASESLFEQAMRLNVRRIAFASTVEVYGPKPDGAVVDEATPCKPDSDYGRTKLLAETALTQLAERHSAAYCNLRFAPVYAPDFRLNLDKRLYLRVPQLGYRFGRGDYRLSLCSVRNIETWLERWLASPNPPNGTFNLADDYAPTALELLKLERRHARANTVLKLPILPCLGALALRETVKLTLGQDPGMYTTANFRKLGRSTFYSNERATVALGSLPGNIEHDLYEGLRT
jgi:UDP-glucose 4-epimerase